MVECGTVGFGGYRISLGNNDHEEALRYAVESGCQLIDTSSNYTDGRSESLIGMVINDYDRKPLIVSKGGYIQGNNLAVIKELNDAGKAVDDLVDISKTLKHSIHPEFLDKQIELSLSRLRVQALDAYLLHNPEYYFEQKDATRDEYYSRIEKALVYLETQVEAGRIKSYGISSNTLVSSPDQPNATSFLQVMEIVDAHGLKGFSYIQFPFNLLERGALDQCENGKNLIENARARGVKTMINRPLNAFGPDNSLVRLADYRQWIKHTIDEQSVSDLYALLFTELTEAVPLSIEDIRSSKGIMTFSKYYKEVESTDMLDILFNRHLIPDFSTLCKGEIPENLVSIIRDLYVAMDRELLERTSEKAEVVAAEFGVVSSADKNLTSALVEYYLSCGVDYVLVGMKHRNYVDQLKYLF